MLTIVELEGFIQGNDPFTKNGMMRTLGISREKAEHSIRQLLALGVIRAERHGSRELFTRVVKPNRDMPPQTGRIEGQSSQSATPEERLLKLLDETSPEISEQLALLNAAQAALLRKLRKV
ncbi:hypothetical protein J4439_05135 [Candidatus Woesearchaeota archaeon]|nr:hypothetical protein [Candidatus Woesearchaeota archaeon]